MDNILQHKAKKALSIIYKTTLSEDEQESVMDDTILYWKNHINEGFLKYRKSVTSGQSYAYLDWSDPYPGTPWFNDHRGKKYLDLLGGYGIYNVGRRHPVVVQAVKAQLQKQALHSQELLDPLRSYCANLLSLTMPSGANRKLDKFFFTNSGTESVEACLKMAMLSTGRKIVVAAVNGFHGKTLGSLSCTSKEKFRSPFIGALFRTVHTPFNDLDALRNVFSISESTGELIGGLILEPIQGEGGIYVGTKEYLKCARELCDKHGAMLIFDEVQSGMGRTGTWWACQHFDVCPDLMAIGKALGGGIMPVGACVGTSHVWQKYVDQPFLMTTTFGGNPLALSATIATVNVIIDEKLCEETVIKGDYLIHGLRRLQKRYKNVIKDIRGMGMMIGVEFVTNELGIEFSKAMFSKNILVAGTLANAQTIRIEPPLTITMEDIKYALQVFEVVIEGIVIQKGEIRSKL
jgi:putrescine aminotransferase